MVRRLTVLALGLVVTGPSLAQSAPASPTPAPPKATAAAPPDAVLLDGVAAVVDRRVITLTEVEAEGRMALVQRAGSRGMTGELDDRFLQKVLEDLVVRELLLVQARRLGIVVAEGEVDRGVAAFKARFDDEDHYLAFLAETGGDEDALRAVVRRDLAVAELLKQVLPQGAVPPEDVAAFLRQNPGFLPEAAPAVRTARASDILAEQRRRKALESYTDNLKQRFEVRVVARFSAP